MLASNIRTRVSQAGTMTSATGINLQGGAAVAGHKTFAQGFNAAGAFAASPVPVLVEKADGSWQTALASLSGDTGVPSSALVLDTLLESSNADNSAITLSASDPVTVTIAPLGALFMGLVTTPRMPAEAAFTSSGTYPAFGAGQGCYPVGNHAVAMGFNSAAGAEGAAVLGLNGASYWDAAMHIAAGEYGNSFGTGFFLAPVAGFFPRFIDTTDATPKELAFRKADGTLGTANLYCEAGLTHYSAVVMAYQSDGSVRRAWRLEWIAETAFDWSTTALLGTVSKTNIYNGDAGAAAWDVDVNFYDGPNSCRIEVTGAAATDIVWVARVDAVVMSLSPP